MLTWAIVYLLTKAKTSGEAGCLLWWAIVADVLIFAIAGVVTVYLVLAVR